MAGTHSSGFGGAPDRPWEAAMSKIILGWQLNDAVPDARVRDIITRIASRYQPLFLDTIEHDGVWHENQGLLHFDVRQDADRRLDRRDDRILCLTGSPTITNHESAFHGVPLTARTLYENVLTPHEQLNEAALHDINPPFTLCWFNKATRRVGLVHDGLGEDQFFISRTSRGVVFSNKCWAILRFLDERPQIDVAAWKYWFCLGWFPGISTPFENVRAVDRGEVVRGDSRSVAITDVDTFSTWMRPSVGSSDDQMLQAMHSTAEIVRLREPSDEKLSTDLTGGIDSRAICAMLIAQHVPCRYFTGGSRFSADVIIAGRIARRFGLDWVHVKDPDLSGQESLEAQTELRFTKMLLWGEGLVEPGRFRHFETEPAPTEHGTYLSGGSAEISKGHYYAAALTGHPDRPFERDAAVARFEVDGRECLSNGDAADVVSLVLDQLSGGEHYGVHGHSLLDYFYLTERTRRWQSAHLAINLFERSLLPFVNVEHITLAFGMGPRDKAEHAFQKFIIARNVEALMRFPVNDDASRDAHFRLARWFRWTSSAGGRKPDAGWAGYFRGAGEAAIGRVFSSETPLWTIVDRAKARDQWTSFLRGADRHLPFVLAVRSFDRWHRMFIQDA